MLRFILFLFTSSTLFFTQAQSVFASGNWYKVGVTESGIYKLDRSFFSSVMGVDVNDIDPATIKIYGEGGGQLPQQNNLTEHLDPPENAIFRQGLTDGSFDQDDFILFFAEGPKKIEVSNGHFLYEDNIYTDTSFYFINVGGARGKSIQNATPLPEGDYPIVETFYDLRYHELNDVNILKTGLRGGSGREWYGELFAVNVSTERSFEFDISGFTGNGEIILATFGQSESDSAAFTVLANGEEVGTQFLDPIRPLGASPYTDRGLHISDTFNIATSSSDQLEVTLRFTRAPGEGQSTARLDKLLVSAERQIQLENNSVIIKPVIESSGPAEILVRNVNDGTQVWNVSKPDQAESMELSINGSVASFRSQLDETSTFVAFEGSDFPAPNYFGRIANQNLKGLNPSDGIIITASEFRSQADRLASFHRSHSGLDIEVINVHQVYNEFASGRQDISAIRNLIKYYYDRSDSFRYVLLFGDCSYDYKERISNNTNFIPTYQARNSVNPISSYSSDDYFGFLEDGEGLWLEENLGDHTLDVGVGRLPVTTPEQAEIIVNKIIRYATSSDVLGDWKTKVTYVVDDGDRNIHMGDAEELSAQLLENRNDVLAQKLYLDAVPQEVGASEEESPEFRSQLIQNIEEGTFLVNYIGHGNEFQWMDENVLNPEDIDGLTNRLRLPIFVAATCQFGRYDDPDFFSGSEQLLLHPNGGAIALLTTTRPVFSSTNFPLNEAFHDAIFDIEDQTYPRIGDIVRKTKNESLRGTRNRNFSLLGDPFLQLDYPDFQATITEINGKDVLVENDTLSALEEINLIGEIRNLSNQLATGFNGNVQIVLLDNETEARTLGQENTPFRYVTQENELFRGSATVTNGRFNASFILTRNTSYRFENAKFILYAVDEESASDASGAVTNIVLGGTDENSRADDNAPAISMYINDRSFGNGSVVEPNGLLIADIEDETGINISENGINQNITLVINEGDPIVINDFYTSSVDQSNTGVVVYPLSNLEPGRYTATIKVWDLYNNSSTATVDFVVSDKVRLRVENLKNYPNPAYSETTFSFEHNRPGEELEINIQFYNSQGQRIEEIIFSADNGLNVVDGLNWNIDPALGAGFYLYKINVRSTLDGVSGSAFGRLIVN